MLCSLTVDRFVHHLKFCFLANNIAFVWPKLFLEREQRQHFSPKAIADLDQFYIPRVLQPVSFALCLTREHHLVATLLSGLHLQSQHPSLTLCAFCCLHPEHIPFHSSLLPSKAHLPCSGLLATTEPQLQVSQG